MEGVAVNAGFWQGRRVFLTGHTGFKGGWMSIWLQSVGAELTGYALTPPTQPNLFEVAHVGRGMRSVVGDIRDASLLQQAMRECRPEVVIHMAAQPLVRYGYQEPVETFATNVMGTVHLLEAVRQCGDVRAVVNVTTDKCYDNREWLWPYRESERLGGRDPYSSSKTCSELVSAAYRSSFFHVARAPALATARAGNVIGGGDWAADRLVPDLLSAFAQGKVAGVRNAHAVRPWQHVLEPLRGYLMLAQRLHVEGAAFAEAWNFGPAQQDARPVEWVAEQLARRWGQGAAFEGSSVQHGHEAGQLRLDATKAGTRLGWQPVLPLGQALDLVIDWERSRLAGEDMNTVTLAQVHGYAALANDVRR